MCRYHGTLRVSQDKSQDRVKHLSRERLPGAFEPAHDVHSQHLVGERLKGDLLGLAVEGSLRLGKYLSIMWSCDPAKT